MDWEDFCWRAPLLQRVLQSSCQSAECTGGPRSDWRRAVAAVSERRVAEGRALYTERSPAELYRGARSSECERYARQASRLGAERALLRTADTITRLHC